MSQNITQQLSHFFAQRRDLECIRRDESIGKPRGNNALRTLGVLTLGAAAGGVVGSIAGEGASTPAARDRLELGLATGFATATVAEVLRPGGGLRKPAERVFTTLHQRPLESIGAATVALGFLGLISRDS